MAAARLRALEPRGVPRRSRAPERERRPAAPPIGTATRGRGARPDGARRRAHSIRFSGSIARDHERSAFEPAGTRPASAERVVTQSPEPATDAKRSSRPRRPAAKPAEPVADAKPVTDGNPADAKPVAKPVADGKPVAEATPAPYQSSRTRGGAGHEVAPVASPRRSQPRAGAGPPVAGQPGADPAPDARRRRTRPRPRHVTIRASLPSPYKHPRARVRGGAASPDPRVPHGGAHR